MAQYRQRVNVVWFKNNDLRVHDHEPLALAHQHKLPVLHVFVFDPFWFGRTRHGRFPKTGSFRAQFLVESVQDLRQNLANLNQNLCVRCALACWTIGGWASEAL